MMPRDNEQQIPILVPDGDDRPGGPLARIDAPPFQLVTSVARARRLSDPHEMLVVPASAEQDEILRAIRSQPATAVSLVFTIEPSALSGALSNGMLQENHVAELDGYRDLRESMTLEVSDELENRLLCYLWLHPKARLSPVKATAHPSLYYYPLLEAWGLDVEESFSLLRALKKRGYLEVGELVSRVRTCPSCDSGLLNFVDVCPVCGDLDIELRSSLHCFNCGHVDSQENFARGAGLVCPNCSTHMKHIGVDYDRPIESQHCNACDSLFVDANVTAECLSCGEKSEPSDLVPQNFHEYGLSPAGRNYVRNGSGHGVSFPNYSGSLVDWSQFLWLAEWQNKLSQRHGQDAVILVIQLVVSKRTNEKGISTLMERLLALAQSSIRETDACCRHSTGCILLLLPQTSLVTINALVRRLNHQSEKSDNQYEIEVRSISLPAFGHQDGEHWLVGQLEALRLA